MLIPIFCALQEMEEAEERLRSRAAELDAARGSAEAAAEKLEAAEARERDLYEENKRLTEHISVSLPRPCLGACLPACVHKERDLRCPAAQLASVPWEHRAHARTGG